VNGRRIYEEARKLRRAKRLMLARRGVTVRAGEARVLQFPRRNDKEEVQGD
jgi:hypothetical protein